jgi:hypothetical protein
MISIVVVILDFTFLIMGFIYHSETLHTTGLFITCVVDVILFTEILLQFYYLYENKKKEALRVEALEKENKDLKETLKIISPKVDKSFLETKNILDTNIGIDEFISETKGEK